MTIRNMPTYDETFTKVNDIVRMHNTSAWELAEGLNMLYYDYREEWKSRASVFKDNPSQQMFLNEMRKQGMNIDPSDDSSILLRMRVEYGFRPIIARHNSIKAIITDRNWVKADKALGYIGAGLLTPDNAPEVMGKLAEVPTTQAHSFLKDFFGADYRDDDDIVDEQVKDDYRKNILPVERALKQISKSDTGLLVGGSDRVLFVPRQEPQEQALERVWADLYDDVCDKEGIDRDALFAKLMAMFANDYVGKRYPRLLKDAKLKWGFDHKRSGRAFPLDRVKAREQELAEVE